MAAEIRIAVFGAGQFGTEHVRVLQAGVSGRCVAVVDPDESRASAVADQFRVERSFSSVREAVAWGGFDAACISSPAETHIDIAEQAAEVASALLIEKPILQTAAHADRLRQVGNRIPILPGHISRFSEPYRTLRRRIAAGEIGDIEWISARRYRGRDHAYRFGASHIAHTTMIHDIDLCIWFSGTATARLLSATGGHVLGLPHPDQVSATLRTPTGVVWRVDASWLIRGTDPFANDRIEIFGTEGQLAAEPVDGFDLDAALAAEHAELAQAARTGHPGPTVTLEEALASVALADQIAAATADAAARTP